LLVIIYYYKNSHIRSFIHLQYKKIKTFDGQHKAVAQFLLGAKKLLVRVFLEPNIDRLTETNTNAGLE